MTALAITAPTGLTPQSVEEAQNMAELLAKSTLVPEHFRGKPSDVFMAIAYGIELGMPPVTSLASIAVIKGKPTLYAATMAALILSSGKAKYFRCVESSATSATYETHRVGEPGPRQKTFTIDDAKAAGLLSGMYSKYPRQMLEARAKSYLARDVYPDVLHGLSSFEEIQDEVEIPQGAVDVSQYESPEAPEPEVIEPDAPSILDQIVGTASLQELLGLVPQLKLLDGKEKAQAQQIYKTHEATLKKAAV